MACGSRQKSLRMKVWPRSRCCRVTLRRTASTWTWSRWRTGAPDTTTERSGAILKVRSVVRRGCEWCKEGGQAVHCCVFDFACLSVTYAKQRVTICFVHSRDSGSCAPCNTVRGGHCVRPLTSLYAEGWLPRCSCYSIAIRLSGNWPCALLAAYSLGVYSRYGRHPSIVPGLVTAVGFCVCVCARLAVDLKIESCQTLQLQAG